MSKLGFVLGNGESRLQYNLHILKANGIIYGCNALYRDFTPDILVSVDGAMIREILESDYRGEVWYIGKGIPAKFFSNVKYPNNEENQESEVCEAFGWASGPSALRLMCEQEKGLKIVNLIGFDLYSSSPDANNVYLGTKNYAEKGSKKTYYGNWLHQMMRVFEKFPNIRFYRVGDVNDTFPDTWKNLLNIKFIEGIVCV